MENTANITIDRQLLRRVFIGIATFPEEELKDFVASFNMWSHVFGIDANHKRVAAYLSQVLYESGYLKYTSENLNYSAEGLLKTWPKRFTAEKAKEYARQPQKIANYVYANRIGNGNEISGDGWRYRGRGYIQLTGRYNYEQFNKYDLCTKDVIKEPDYVSKYPLNQIASMWFWETNKLNTLADIEDITNITKRINEGLLGLNTRKLIYRRLTKEFGIKKL